MLNSIKIKLRSFLLSFKRKKAPVFVNPYAPVVKGEPTKINPYVTEYGAVKKKSFDEMIKEKLRPEKIQGTLALHKLGEPYPVAIVQKTPTFAHDMQEMFIRDIMTVAARFGQVSKQKERVMTSDEIRKACENTKW